jgi:hypothetical protein
VPSLEHMGLLARGGYPSDCQLRRVGERDKFASSTSMIDQMLSFLWRIGCFAKMITNGSCERRRVTRTGLRRTNYTAPELHLRYLPLSTSTKVGILASVNIDFANSAFLVRNFTLATMRHNMQCKSPVTSKSRYHNADRQRWVLLMSDHLVNQE